MYGLRRFVPGTLCALMLAMWVGTALRRMLLPNIHWADGAIDARVMLFTAGAALVTGFLAGLAPVVQAIKPDLINSLRAGSREGAYRRSRLRSVSNKGVTRTAFRPKP